jgi:adenylate cyclase
LEHLEASNSRTLSIKCFILLIGGFVLAFSQSLFASVDENDTTSLYFQAGKLLEAGKYQESLDTYKAFLDKELSVLTKDWVKVSESQSNIGICYYLMNNYREAITWYEQALETDRKTGALENIATRYSNMGLAYKKLGLYDKASEYYKQALAMDEQQQDSGNIAKSYNNLGSIYDSWGRYDSAIFYYDKSLKLKEALQDSAGMAISLNNIGIVYKSWGKYDAATEYFEEALKIDRSLGKTKEIPKRLNNIGLTYNLRKEYDKALNIFMEALNLSIDDNNKELIASVYSNMGSSYMNLKQYSEAIRYQELALEIYEESGNQSNMATVLASLSDIYKQKGDYNHAMSLLSRSTNISEEINMRNQSKKNYLAYSELYTAMGNFSEALNYYKKYVALKDTLYTEEIHKQIAGFEVRYETEKKDNEITLLKQNQEIQDLSIKKERIVRNSLIGLMALILILAGVIYWSLQQKRIKNRVIASEKAKSDQLLQNILPASIAHDLKEKGKTEPKLYENVTVCFTDMVGFTEMAALMKPKKLIDELNNIFTAFDDIVGRHQCERIKTIGDSYMAVCGLPGENSNHAENIIRAAVEMVHYIERKNMESDVEWQMRVGVHSGSVIAGVVGTRKYLYDVFGDTINTASRLESASEPMRINISESTYDLVKDIFKFESRGQFDVKGKGRISMYFLTT